MKSLLSLLLATVATQASAEDESYVYKTHVCSEENYQGVCHEFHDAVPSLSNYDLDNTISSFKATGVTASDLVDHTAVINKPISLGFSPKPHLIVLLADFLTGRRQTVRYHGSMSSYQQLTCRIPQGAKKEARIILGPAYNYDDALTTTSLPKLSTRHQDAMGKLRKSCSVTHVYATLTLLAQSVPQDTIKRSYPSGHHARTDTTKARCPPWCE
ncbi:hypothetical protein E2C01_025414 [Portunus trituberculatus]|uniref:Uncharacterized protein n=1 Tax=Portunus trituberculatus TaxID=210409 RepID=A0A5B7EFQ3_PORTR|nr:hypothetical protein [Portunus trituberculatus]